MNGGKITNLEEYKAWLQHEIYVCLNNAAEYSEADKAGFRADDIVIKYFAYADAYKDALQKAQEIE